MENGEKEKVNLEQELIKKEKLKQEKIKYQKLHGKKESKSVFNKEAAGEMGDRPLFIIDGKSIGRIEGDPSITVKKMIESGSIF